MTFSRARELPAATSRFAVWSLRCGHDDLFRVLACTGDFQIAPFPILFEFVQTREQNNGSTEVADDIAGRHIRIECLECRFEVVERCIDGTVSTTIGIVVYDDRIGPGI